MAMNSQTGPLTTEFLRITIQGLPILLISLTHTQTSGKLRCSSLAGAPPSLTITRSQPPRSGHPRRAFTAESLVLGHAPGHVIWKDALSTSVALASRRPFDVTLAGTDRSWLPPPRTLPGCGNFSTTHSPVLSGWPSNGPAAICNIRSLCCNRFQILGCRPTVRLQTKVELQNNQMYVVVRVKLNYYGSVRVHGRKPQKTKPKTNTLWRWLVLCRETQLCQVQRSGMIPAIQHCWRQTWGREFVGYNFGSEMCRKQILGVMLSLS